MCKSVLHPNKWENKNLIKLKTTFFYIFFPVDITLLLTVRSEIRVKKNYCRKLERIKPNS